MTRGMGLTGPMAGSLDSRDFAIAISSELFADISPPLLELILPRTRMIRLDPGEVLIERGALNDFVYLILEGSLHVHLDDAQAPHFFALGPGTCAGEISVIDGGGATAKVVAAEQSRLLSIDGRTLWYLVANTDAAARNLLLIFSGRMRRDNELLLGSLRERQAFERVSSVDALTGLHNAKWMQAMFSRQLARCAHDDAAASLVLVDVDQLREFNARHGQVKGDRGLQQIAATIAGCVRPSDLLARNAGDEFAILLPFAGLQQAQYVAERVRQSVLRKAVAANGPGQNAQSLTVSLGVAEMKTNDTLDRLLGAAGAAVQQAKAEGGNRVHLAAS